MEWFQAGGWCMFVVLLAGIFGIVQGVRALLDPSAARVAGLRSLPTLIGYAALFGFGTNMWSINIHLSDPAFVAATGIPADAMSATMGMTEAAQALTLGAMLAFVVVLLRYLAETKHAKLAAS